MSELRAGCGSSESADSRRAGQDAARQAVGKLAGGALALVIVYASIRYDLTALLAGVRSITGDAPLAGSSSSGQIIGGATVAPGAGVTVLVLSGDRYRFGVASASGLHDRSFVVGQELTRSAMAAVGPDRPPYGTLLIFADSLTGDLQSLLNGIYQVAGTVVPVVGGAASADQQMEETYVFHGDRVLNDSAVAIWIGSDRPKRVVVRHGWSARGLPMLVTRAAGPVVHEIAGQPARDLYLEHFRPEDIPEDTEDEWWRDFHATRAFGLIEPDGSETIRGVFVDANGLVRTFTPLPPYCAVRIMSATSDDLLDVIEPLAVEAIEGQRASVLLVFSCAARMDILRERVWEEAARLQEAAGNVITFGYYTYGEFARTTAVSGYHNATIAAIAL